MESTAILKLNSAGHLVVTEDGRWTNESRMDVHRHKIAMVVHQAVSLEVRLYLAVLLITTVI